MAAKAIPEGYHSVSPALAIDGAAEAIDFYKRAFGAKERLRMPGPDGKIAHAELEIGDSVLMLSDPFPHSTVKPPTALGGTSVGIFVYVEDVDAAAVARRLLDDGVLAGAMDARTLRMVTHPDVSDADCKRAADALRGALALRRDTPEGRRS